MLRGHWTGLIAILTGLMAFTSVSGTTASVVRHDFRVKTEDGVGIFVREIRVRGVARRGESLYAGIWLRPMLRWKRL